MIERYKHTQVGYLIITIFSIAILFLAFLIIIYEFNWIVFAVLIVLALCMLLFAKMTVIIDKDNLEIFFGPGFIKKKFSLKEIDSVKIVKNPWFYGWGIHITPNGWLYNVSGFYAIEIKTKKGTKYRIGTDDPEKLEKTLKEIINI